MANLVATEFMVQLLLQFNVVIVLNVASVMINELLLHIQTTVVRQRFGGNAPQRAPANLSARAPGSAPQRTPTSAPERPAASTPSQAPSGPTPAAAANAMPPGVRFNDSV